jgi:hypothetical protein
LIGGSGGGACCGYKGGGGGGAILIASSMTQTITGSILANGGYSDQVGDGSGGAVRLVGNTITGNGAISARGGTNGPDKGYGRVRLEACNMLRAPASAPPATYGWPGVVFLTNNPTIQITSVAGVSVPSIPTGSFTVPDITSVTNFTSPITVNVLASNINPGTSFSLILTPKDGDNIVTNGALSGTFTSSTGSVSIACYTNAAWRLNALIDYIPRP